jgi:outer membrane cobalamin receptor
MNRYLIDEVWYDPGFLNSLPVSDIAMIKIIKGPFAGGFNSPGGVIAIYTIRGEDEGEE